MPRAIEDKTDKGDTRPVIIYADAIDITMKKLDGKYADGKPFIHKFKRGNIIVGLPRGCVVLGGRGGKRWKLRLPKRAILVVHQHQKYDMWEERIV